MLSHYPSYYLELLGARSGRLLPQDEILKFSSQSSSGNSFNMTQYNKWGFFHCQFPLQDVLDSNFLIPLNRELEGMPYKLACSVKQSPSPAINHNLQAGKHDISSSSTLYQKDIRDMVLNIHMITNKKT